MHTISTVLRQKLGDLNWQNTPRPAGTVRLNNQVSADTTPQEG
jgi:hypothetical protein